LFLQEKQSLYHEYPELQEQMIYAGNFEVFTRLSIMRMKWLLEVTKDKPELQQAMIHSRNGWVRKLSNL
jgi:hypothetical protein